VQISFNTEINRIQKQIVNNQTAITRIIDVRENALNKIMKSAKKEIKSLLADNERLEKCLKKLQ